MIFTKQDGSQTEIQGFDETYNTNVLSVDDTRTAITTH